MIEQWKTIKQAPDYEVSTFGNVRIKKTGFLMKSRVTREGVVIIKLKNNHGEPKVFTIPQLVARAFIPGLENRKRFTVRHINCDSKDNRVTNLRVANTEKKKSSNSAKTKRKQWLMVYNKHKKPLRSFRSLGEICRTYGLAKRTSINEIQIQLYSRDLIVKWVDEAEAFPYYKRDMKKRAEVQEKIDLFIHHVEGKYGLDWYKKNLKNDKFVQEHYKYMQSVK